MIYVISKSTFGDYAVRDIQCNANWDCCPYSDYALIPENLVEGVLATRGYCDITLNDAGDEVTAFTAREIPSVPAECCGENTVLSVNGVKANTAGELTLTAAQVGARPDTWLPTIEEIGAAPAGYGLGQENTYIISNANTALKDGRYGIDASTLQIPIAADGELVVVSRDGNVKHQTIYYSNEYRTICHRDVVGGYFKPWEFSNPPMLPGVEYRTTERYNGQTVYTKLIDCGELSDGKRVDTGKTTIFRHSGNLSGRHSLPYDVSQKSDSSYWAESKNEGSYLAVWCGSGIASNGYVWWEQIWWI